MYTYGVERILSVLAWFIHQNYFHVKYNVSILFSICHLPHTNFVYSVCILRSMVLIILEGNMSLPVKPGDIQGWTEWGSPSLSWNDHRNWLKKLTLLAMSCGCKVQSLYMAEVEANLSFLLVMILKLRPLMQDNPLMFVVNVLAKSLFCQILFRSTRF